MVSGTKWTDEQVAAAFNILKGATREKPVTSAQVKEKLKVDDFEGRWVSRNLILEVIKRHKLPLASNDSGYFVMKTYEDLRQYREDLHKRAMKIYSRIKIMEDAYDATYGKKSEDDSEDTDDIDENLP
jgi:hypothetical protein